MIFVKLFEWFCAFVSWIQGWKVVAGIPPEVKKAVVIVVPHTSNWDFIYGMNVKNKYKMQATYFAKKELFKWPLKTILEKTGGVRVDRSSPKDMVSQIVEKVHEADSMYIVIAPEGTRGPTEKWKTGFYQIAMQANIPILLAFIDYKTKTAGIDELFYPTGDKEKDFEHFKQYYSKVYGKNPENHNKEKLL